MPSDLPSLSPSVPCPLPGGIPWSGPCPWHRGDQSPLGMCHPQLCSCCLCLCSAPGSLAAFKQFKPLTFHQDLSQLLKPHHPLSLFNALYFSCWAPRRVCNQPQTHTGSKTFILSISCWPEAGLWLVSRGLSLVFRLVECSCLVLCQQECGGSCCAQASAKTSNL